jgi:hypothetical protein
MDMEHHRVFRLANPIGNVSHDGKAKKIKVSEKGSMRDGEAAIYVLMRFAEMGYRFGGTIMNLPPAPGESPRQEDLSRFRRGDRIVAVGRLPLNDREVGELRAIPQSDSNLETILFRELRKTFFSCARSEIVLQPGVVRCDRRVAARRSIEPQKNGGSGYLRYSNPDVKNSDVDCKHRPPRTAAYLVQTKELWDGGPSATLAFGVGSDDTRLICHALSGPLSDLLDTAAFAMFEFTPVPRGRVRSFDDLDGWDIDILGTIPRASSTGSSDSGSLPPAPADVRDETTQPSV